MWIFSFGGMSRASCMRGLAVVGRVVCEGMWRRVGKDLGWRRSGGGGGEA